MAGNWRIATVTQLQHDGILLVEDGNHGEYRPRPDEFVDRGVAFIRAADMDAGRVLFESAAKINERARQRITKGIGAPGDVLLSHKGTVGKVALVAGKAPPFVCSPQTTFWRTRDDQQLDRQYLYAFLRSSGFHAQLATRAGETDMAPYVSLTSQRGLSVTLPPIGIQRAIAHILGTLDDKIQLNRRMNETLEAMARALFTSWFVDFDAVRAKAEGRAPGLRKALADLFPACLEESELGEIPAGWRVAPVGELCRRVAMGPFGSDIKTENFVDSGVPVVRGGNLTDGFIEDGFVFVPEAKADQLRNANAFPGDIVITHRGTLGQVGLIPERSRFPRYVVSQSQMLLSVDSSVVTSRYLYDFFRSTAGQHALLANTSQTGVPAIARPTSSVRAIQCVVPPIQVLREFGSLVDEMYRRRDSAKDESRTLAAIRDALLPRLISGEIRVGTSR